jgi:integration host factor subunit beta
MSITKRDIGIALSGKLLNSNQEEVFKIVNATFEELIEQLSKGNRVEIRGFGNFEIQKRKPRIGRNPNRPQDVVTIPERNVVKFKTGRLLQENISKLKV